MRNKFLYQILCLSSLLMAQVAFAQTNNFLLPEDVAVGQSASNLPNLANKEVVDFPARTSLDSMELAPLPGLNETNITGPEPLAPSVSTKDLPSERLLGMLTPEVFKEMAELERDNTFLKLQIQRETMKNDLEKLRANYRQARLDEIAKREDVVRTRIQWWQEQEKIRQDLENQRAMLEAAKQEQGQPINDLDDTVIVGNGEDGEETETVKSTEKTYTLMDIMGTRGALSARIKDIKSGRVLLVQTGDKLSDGSQIESITPSQVILVKEGEKIALVFDDV